MKNWLLPGCILILSGCHGSSSLSDPFAPYGMRIVPPPGTGSVGTPSGYAQQPANMPPSLLPGGATSWQTTPTTPPSFIPPAQNSAASGEGNWHSIAGRSSADLGLAPPVVPTNPYAQGTSFAESTPLRDIARTSAELNWGTTSAPIPSSAAVPAMQYAQPPVAYVPQVQPYTAAPIPVATYDSYPAYSTPVRPSVVRSVNVSSPSLPILADSEPCCEPIASPDLPLAPIAYAESPNSSTWQPRQ